MYFEHTYKHKISYAMLFMVYLMAGVAVFITYDHPYWYFVTGAALAFVAVMTYQHYAYSDKLVVGMNEDGMCIWQSRNTYLFCSWDAIEHIAVRQEYRVTNNSSNKEHYSSNGQWVKYIDISFTNGTTWFVEKQSTYVKDRTDTYLKVVSEQPSTKEFHYLYETNVELPVETLAKSMKLLKEQYQTSRGYGQSDYHELCKCTKQLDSL